MNKARLFKASRTTDDIRELAKIAGVGVPQTRRYLSKRWKDEADKAWREYVKKCDGEKCVICGRGGKLDAHHLIRRSHLRYRFEPMNGITLCPGHHVFGNCVDGICAESDTQGSMRFIDWLKGHRHIQYAWLQENINLSSYKMTWNDLRDACLRLEAL